MQSAVRRAILDSVKGPIWRSVLCSARASNLCVQTIGDELVDSIVSDNIPVLAEDAKFNEAVTSSLRRIEVGKYSGETQL